MATKKVTHERADRQELEDELDRQNMLRKQFSVRETDHG
jgi:hypothetical protein